MQAGAIAQAELISLSPQVVVYTINPTYHWSNGAPFSLADLVTTYRVGLRSTVARARGYAYISSLSKGVKPNTLRATFTQPYAAWQSLFRDVEYAGSAERCATDSLWRNPSLGPYDVTSARSGVVQLSRNSAWQYLTGEYNKVVIYAGTSPNQVLQEPFVDYRYVRSYGDSVASRQMPRSFARFGITSTLQEMGFSPIRPLTAVEGIRVALSWAVDRQSLINQTVGKVSSTVGVPRSALITQAVAGYGPGSGYSLVDQMTTTTLTATSDPVTNAQFDCTSCAEVVLRRTPGVTGSRGGPWYLRGSIIRLRVVVGPSGYDQASADITLAAWSKFGIPAYVIRADSEVDAASRLAAGAADVAFYGSSASDLVSSASAWYGPRSSDLADTGWRTPDLSAIALQALNRFNAVNANASWKALDAAVLTGYYVRPLFPTTYYQRWSSWIANVTPSPGVDTFIGEIPTWSHP